MLQFSLALHAILFIHHCDRGMTGTESENEKYDGARNENTPKTECGTAAARRCGSQQALSNARRTSREQMWHFVIYSED